MSIFSSWLCTAHPVFVTGCFHGTMCYKLGQEASFCAQLLIILQELILFLQCDLLSKSPTKSLDCFQIVL